MSTDDRAMSDTKKTVRSGPVAEREIVDMVVPDSPSHSSRVALALRSSSEIFVTHKEGADPIAAASPQRFRVRGRDDSPA